MPTFDFPLDELRAYAPDLAEPADLDAFWADTLADARGHDLDVRLERVDTGLTALETWDVTSPAVWILPSGPTMAMPYRFGFTLASAGM